MTFLAARLAFSRGWQDGCSSHSQSLDVPDPRPSGRAVVAQSEYVHFDRKHLRMIASTVSESVSSAAGPVSANLSKNRC